MLHKRHQAFLRIFGLQQSHDLRRNFLLCFLRTYFEQELRQNLKIFEAKIPEFKGLSRRERSLAVLALSIGTINLSRAVHDPQLSDEIIQAGRKAAQHHLDL